MKHDFYFFQGTNNKFRKNIGSVSSDPVSFFIHVGTHAMLLSKIESPDLDMLLYMACTIAVNNMEGYNKIGTYK